MDERIESLRILFGQAVKQMGFTAQEVSHLLRRKRLDNPKALDHATTQDVAQSLVQLSAVFHLWSMSFDDVRQFVRTERFPLKDEYTGQTATIAEAFLSRDISQFEDTHLWADKSLLEWLSARHRESTKSQGRVPSVSNS